MELAWSCCSLSSLFVTRELFFSTSFRSLSFSTTSVLKQNHTFHHHHPYHCHPPQSEVRNKTPHKGEDDTHLKDTQHFAWDPSSSLSSSPISSSPLHLPRCYPHLKETMVCLILSDSSSISVIALSTILWWLQLTLFCSSTCHQVSDLSSFVQFVNTCKLSLSSVSLNSSWLFLTSTISLSISPSFWSPAVLLEQILCNISARSSAFFSNFFSMSCKMEKSNLCPC